MTHEALTILQMIGVDPAQAPEATVALAERSLPSKIKANRTSLRSPIYEGLSCMSDAWRSWRSAEG